MLKNILLYILFLSSSCLIKAQVSMHPMLKLGYEYQSSNFGEIGMSLAFLKTDNAIYRIGGSALLGIAHGKTAISPKLQGDVLLNFQRGKSLNHSYYFLVGAESTLQTITPKIGISLFGILDFTGGYGFPIAHQTLNGKKIKGPHFALGLNIPLVIFKK